MVQTGSQDKIGKKKIPNYNPLFAKILKTNSKTLEQMKQSKDILRGNHKSATHEHMLPVHMLPVRGQK